MCTKGIRRDLRFEDLTFDRRQQPEAAAAAVRAQLCWEVWTFIILVVEKKAPRIASSSQVENNHGRSTGVHETT